jgi:hypothetical protein
MEEIIHVDKRWASFNVKWNPISTRLYFGILFYIQTLRCMFEARILSFRMQQFLGSFLDTIPLETLPIPGPLVLFFRALCVCDSPYPEYGPVSPTIPSQDRINLKDGTLDHHSMALLPNIVGLRRAFQAMQRVLTNRIPLLWNANLGLDEYVPLPSTPPGNQQANFHMQMQRILPGTVYDIPWRTQQCFTWANETTKMQIPPTSFPPNVCTTDWPSILGLECDMHWFTTLASEHVDYCSYWNGSTTLATISCSNSPIPLVECRQSSEICTVDATSFNDSLTRYECVGISKSSKPEPPADQIGLLTQIHFVPSSNFIPNISRSDFYDATHEGPLWHTTPNRSSARAYDPSLSLPMLIRSIMISHKS